MSLFCLKWSFKSKTVRAIARHVLSAHYSPKSPVQPLLNCTSLFLFTEFVKLGSKLTKKDLKTLVTSFILYIVTDDVTGKWKGLSFISIFDVVFTFLVKLFFSWFVSSLSTYFCKPYTALLQFMQNLCCSLWALKHLAFSVLQKCFSLARRSMHDLIFLSRSLHQRNSCCRSPKCFSLCQPTLCLVL